MFQSDSSPGFHIEATSLLNVSVTTDNTLLTNVRCLLIDDSDDMPVLFLGMQLSALMVYDMQECRICCEQCCLDVRRGQTAGL
jgi:hypothetical protein